MPDLTENNAFITENRDKQSVEQPTEPKETVVLPTDSKPIEVTPTVEKNKEVNAMTDPEGIFDYSNCDVYTVQEGESLLTVAQKYVVAMQQLRYFNHLEKGAKIKAGDKLVIPNKPINVPYGK